MERISTTNKAVDLFGAGKHGFQDGNPGAGVFATFLSAAFCNALQEEIANTIEGAGIALNPADRTQLLAAVNALIAAFANSAYLLKSGGVMTGPLSTPGDLTQGVNSGGNSAVILTGGGAIRFKLSGDTASQVGMTEWKNNSGVTVANDWMTGDAAAGIRRYQLAGAGSHDFITGTVSIAGNVPQFRVEHAAGATRGVRVGGSNGGDPYISTTSGNLNLSAVLVTGGATAATGFTTSGDITAPVAGAIRSRSTFSAWARFNNSGTVTRALNVGSVTKTGSGDFTANIIAGVLADGSYGFLGMPSMTTVPLTFAQSSATAPTATAFRIALNNSTTGAPTDFSGDATVGFLP